MSRCETLADGVTRQPNKTCEVCGAAFWVKAYRVTTARFCSQVCGGHWHAKTRLANVPKPWMLGNQLRRGISPANKGASGPKGSESPSFIQGRERACEGCGTTFRQPPWMGRQNGPQKFCTRACFHQHGQKKGHEAPDYVGGPKTYRGRGWLVARAKVVSDQHGDCADCGVHVGPSIAVHHIIPFRCFATAADANQRDNLIGLCQSCHMRREAKVARLHPAQPDLFGIAAELARPRLPLPEPVKQPVQEVML